MCLGIPGQVTAVDGEGLARMGRVRFAGIERTVGLALVPEAQVGDYVIVHVGYAITRLDPEAAHRTLRLWESLAAPGEEEAGDGLR